MIILLNTMRKNKLHTGLLQRISLSWNKRLLINIIKLLGILFICLLGFRLRLRNYNSVPRPGESLDEYSNAWSGLGLIELGLPLGWSYLENDLYQPSHHYVNVDNVYQVGTIHASPFYLYSPWLDHPPGMGLLIGGFAHLKGARVLEDASTVFIRKPMLYLGTLNILLLFLIGCLYFNFKTGMLAATIYAVSPLIVVANRLPQAENVIVPLFLLSTILVKLFQDRKNYVYLFLSALLAGSGIWFKIPALMITVSGALLILFSSLGPLRKRLKSALIFALISISFGFLPLLAYGLALDSRVFFQVLLFNARRSYGIGLSALYKLFTQSKVTGSISLTDGWLIFAWFSWLILLTKIKIRGQRCLISIPLFTCLTFFIFLGSEFYGWYVYPFLPWLALSIAILVNSLRDINILPALSVLVTLPAQILLFKSDVAKDFPNFTVFWRFAFAFYLFFVGLVYVNSNKSLIKIQKVLIYVWFTLGVFLSIKYSYDLGPEVWPLVN